MALSLKTGLLFFMESPIQLNKHPLHPGCVTARYFLRPALHCQVQNKVEKEYCKKEAASLGFSFTCSHVLGREMETFPRFGLAPALRNMRFVTKASAQSVEAAIDDADESPRAREKRKIPAPCPEQQCQAPLMDSAHSHRPPQAGQRGGDPCSTGLKAFLASRHNKQQKNDKYGRICRVSLLYKSPCRSNILCTAQLVGRGDLPHGHAWGWTYIHRASTGLRASTLVLHTFTLTFHAFTPAFHTFTLALRADRRTQQCWYLSWQQQEPLLHQQSRIH